MRYSKSGKLLAVLLVLLALCCFKATSYAASDPSIKDWGSPPGTPPPWQTTDIFVDNDGDGIANEAEDLSTGQLGEPSKGIINRLFAKVRNLGTTGASNVTVRFAYAPYGAWGWAAYGDFKEIAVVNGVVLGPAGSPDAEKIIEVQWDLRDLSENNGGKWGGYTVGDFDHFCVWVKLEFNGDSNPGNNDARNNFVNVKTVFGKSYSIKFLISNPKKERASAELLIKGIPENWKFDVLGIPDYRRFELKPQERRLITINFTAPAQLQAGGPIKRAVDLSLKLNNEIIGGVSFTATVDKEKSPFVPSGGVLSPYLIGTYDLRSGGKTVLHILNPTAKYLRVMIAVFDDNEKPLSCIKDKLSPNDLLEVDLKKYDLKALFGVVKVVSMNEKEDVPEIGLVGYQRHFFPRLGVTETILHPIPGEILADDLKYIWKACK